MKNLTAMHSNVSFIRCTSFLGCQAHRFDDPCVTLRDDSGPGCDSQICRHFLLQMLRPHGLTARLLGVSKVRNIADAAKTLLTESTQTSRPVRVGVIRIGRCGGRAD